MLVDNYTTLQMTKAGSKCISKVLKLGLNPRFPDSQFISETHPDDSIASSVFRRY